MGRTDKEIYRVIDNVNSYYRINSESKKELLLNKYPNAAAAYSLRLLDGYYRGPLVRVRRNDGVEVDVYPDYNNQLSLDSLVTNVPVHTTNDGIPDEDYTFQLSLSSLGEFVGATGYSSTVSATDATVCVWYDQSSTDGVANDNDASQNVADNQPLIVSGGVIVAENGKAAALFSGDYLNSGAVSATGTATNFAVAHVDGGSGNRSIFYTPEIVAFRATSNFRFVTQGTQRTYASTRLDDRNLHYFGADSSQGFGAINGATITTNAEAAGSGTKIAIGTQITNAIPFYGYIQECVYYNSDQSSNRGGIEEDINSFYQIDGYTPTPKLIDLTQDLAVQNGGTTADGTPAAAYSLRLLSSTYTGPLVRIRRTIDNTEVDVYPDSDGEFSIYSTIQDGGTELTTGVTGGSTDKTTLHEFLYGQDTDCTVVVWYDQAGANDATQTTTTAQGKIYDSTSGVYMQGGKPAIEFGLGNARSMTGSITLSQPMTYYVAAKSESSDGVLERSVFIEDSGNTYSWGIDINGRAVAVCPSVILESTGQTRVGTELFTFVCDGASSAIYTDGNLSVSGDVGSNGLTGTQSVLISRGDRPPEYVHEFVLFDNTSNRTDIEQNINQHYNIY